MTRFSLDGGNWFDLRVNEWDERAFGFRVTEILGIAYEDDRILDRVDEENRKLDAQLCCMRADANDLRTKADFLRKGYQIVECSWNMDAQAAKLKTRRYFDVRLASSEQMPDLLAIAQRFEHSRFHEDPFLPRHLAANRFVNWIRDRFQEGLCFVGVNRENEVVGFVVAKRHGADMHIELVGVHPRHRGLGAFFYSAFLHHLKPGTRRFFTTISTANLGAANIHIWLGFRVRAAKFDYHKRYGPLQATNGG